MGQDLQGVTGDDGRSDAVHRPHGRAVMAFGVGVDDVVVDEREVVDELDGHRAGHPDLGVGPRRLGGEDGQGRPDALAARQSRPGCRRGRSSPCGRWPAGGSRAPDARWPRSGPGRRPGGTGPGPRGRQWSGSRHLLGVGWLKGVRQGQGRPGPVLVAVRDAPARGVPARATAAAARPLRTAPSMVAGQPVSVHAPATARPGQEVAGPGRSRAVPGRARKVAARSLVTRESTSRAPAASGSRRPSSAATHWVRSSGRRPSRSSAAEIDTATYCGPCGSLGIPDEAVRSNTHSAGDPRPAKSGQRVTGRSKTRCTSTTGEVPRSARSVLVGDGTGRQQRPGRVVGNGHDHGVGRQGLQPAVVTEKRAAAPIDRGRAPRPGPRPPDGLRRRPARGRRRPARRAVARAAPGSNRCRRRRRP